MVTENEVKVLKDIVDIMAPLKNAVQFLCRRGATLPFAFNPGICRVFSRKYFFSGYH
jgi:hypothetical protein